MTNPTNDLSEFDELSRNRSTRPGKCVVARRIDELAPDERATLVEALNHTDDAGEYRYGGSTLARWWRKRGVRIDGQSVTKHRRGDCCCE